MDSLKETVLNLWRDKNFVRQNFIVWLVIYLLFILIEFSADGLRSIEGYVDVTVITIGVGVLFYFQFFICTLFLEKNKVKFYSCIGVVFIFYIVLIGYLVNQNKGMYTSQTTTAFLIERFFIGIISYLVIVFTATSYWSLRNNLIKSKLNASLEQDKIKLQAQLLQSENNFLRAQINPHFLYNCLNFLYSKTFKEQPKVSEAIMMLSQIMRYSLTDFSVTNGLANLQDEIEHIENLIKINEFRFDNTLQISFALEGNTDGKKIAPMLLMTLVENVFKHGDLQNPAYAATITCKIDVTLKTIQFITRNKKNKAQSNLSSGVGLANIKQRLQLLYNDDFKLLATEEPAIYTVELIMPYFY